MHQHLAGALAAERKRIRPNTGNLELRAQHRRDMRIATAGLMIFVALGCQAQPTPGVGSGEARATDHRLAQSGDVDAMHRLCYDFTYGEGGLVKDHGRARVWCAAAGERGNASCQTLYAQLLLGGEGGPADTVAAAKWYSMAAAQHHVHAQYMLGLLISAGSGVPRNTAVGDSLLAAAEAQGMPEAAAARKRATRAGDKRTPS